MNFVEYTDFLLDIGIKYKNYRKKPLTFLVYQIKDPTTGFLTEVSKITDKPIAEITMNEWYQVGYVLGQVFGLEAYKYIYPEKFKGSENE